MEIFLNIVKKIWIFLTLIFIIDCKAKLSLKITKYHTYSYRRLDGQCCGEWSSPNRRICPNECSQKFKICLEYYQAEVSLTDPKPYNGPCAYGSKDTNLWGNSNMQFSNQYIYPYNFDIQNSWPTYITIIIEAYDYTNTKPLNLAVIDRIAYRNSLKPIAENKQGKEWYEVTLSNRPSIYQFSVKLECQNNYYGVACDKYCKNNFGHFKCDKSGYKVCNHGWMGPDCNTTICKPGCHSVHGYCKKPGECLCTEGWKGPYCDECIPYPGCVHGTCIDSPWTCYCQPNWGGYFCDKSLNYCAENNPCKNEGLCENQPEIVDPYKCICPTGFHGKNCETDSCIPNPCKKGTCMKSKDGSYCQCFSGWKGQFCELDSNICDETSCKNGGICKKDENGIFKCICQPGFKGSECHLAAPCENSECKHALQCQVISNINGEYECLCQPGWKGKFCDKEINECDSNPCKNGGICKDLLNDYMCQCKKGFRGKQCEVNVACQKKPCKNGGVCQEIDTGFVCKCKQDYSGINCEIFKTGCSPNPCRNGAYCYTIEQDFYCQCDSKFWGKHCEYAREYCGREPCSMAYDACSIASKNSSHLNRHICGKYGTCVSKTNMEFECKCMIGFDGKYCENNIDNCHLTSCENEGTCIDGINDFECICENGFHGKRCEQKIDYCSQNPCINGGECITKNDKNYNDFICKCYPPFEGRLCHQTKPTCENNPCLHQGICSKDHYERNIFKCDCKDGWIGSVCQFKESGSKPCTLNDKCLNGGICLNFGDDDYTCQCPEGYEGKNCETNVNECHPNPCFNGGKCIDLINSFECKCPIGFFGSHCQSNIDECIRHPCAYGSVCIDRINGFECRCPKGRNGILCDQVNDNQSPQPPSCIYYNRTFDSGQHWSYNCNNCRCETGKITCIKAKCGVWTCQKANGIDDPYACKDDEVCHVFHFDDSRCFVRPCVAKANCFKRTAEIPERVISWPGETNKHCRPNANQKNNFCAQILLHFEKSNMPIGVTIDDICDSLKVLPVVKSYKGTVQGDFLEISCEVSDVNPSIINVALYSPKDNMLLLKSINTLRPFVHFLSDKIADNLIEVVRQNYSILSGLVDIKVETLLLHSDMSDKSDLMKYMIIPFSIVAILIIAFIIWYHRKKMDEIRERFSTQTAFNNNTQFQPLNQHQNIRSTVQTSGLVPNQSHYVAFPGDKLHSQNIPTMWSHGHHPFNN